jgi:hypothetical protein
MKLVLLASSTPSKEVSEGKWRCLFGKADWKERMEPKHEYLWQQMYRKKETNKSSGD